MDLTAERLRAALKTRQCEFYPQVNSTNDRARTLLAEGAPAGSIVIADEQTHGRGRMGRVWVAPAGTALMFSYLLHPAPDELTFIGMMGALAVCQVVETLGARAGIKWPNDVQIDRRKLCGVLPEALWQGEHLIGVVLGIGVNVRVDFSATAFAGTAVSLENEIGTLDRVNLLERLLERLDEGSARLASDALFEAWRGRLVMLGRHVSIGDVQGIAETVDRQGALLIRDDAGALRRVIAGDIALG